MTTSGSTDFSLSQTDIIHDAMSIAGILAIGQSPSADDYVACQNLLNAMVKTLSGSSMMNRGLKLWARKRATLFLQNSQSKYSLGTDHASTSCHNTTLSANAAISATSLTVASITGIATGDILGVVLNDNTVHWTTVNGAPTGHTVVAASGLASAASSGNRVYTYTTIMQRPIKILSALLRDEDGNDTPLGEINLGQYENISNKLQENDPLRYYPEAQVDTFDLYLDGYPADTSKTIELVYLRPFDDFDNVSDTPDFPQEWYECLLYGLSVRICIAYSKPVTQELAGMAKIAQDQANSFYPETSSLYFEPDRPL